MSEAATVHINWTKRCILRMQSLKLILFIMQRKWRNPQEINMCKTKPNRSDPILCASKQKKKKTRPQFQSNYSVGAFRSVHIMVFRSEVRNTDPSIDAFACVQRALRILHNDLSKWSTGPKNLAHCYNTVKKKVQKNWTITKQRTRKYTATITPTTLKSTVIQAFTYYK